MNSKRHALAVFGFALLCLPAAWSQGAYPNKPVRFVVPFAAGGESDVVARLLAAKLQSKGYTTVVENKLGAGGNLGAEAALREPADGYTLLVISGAYAANAVVLRPSFDPVAAIQPIVQFTRQPSVIVGPPTKFNSLKELIDVAKKAPGTVNYGSAGIGSLGNLSGELFSSLAGIKLTHIPYKGNSGAMTDLMGGQVDMMLSGVSAARALAATGKVRILAVTGDKRLPELPNVPTFAEVGVPLEGDLWHGLVASKDVPKPIVDKLNADINAVLKDPEIVARLKHELLAPVGGTPEQFTAIIRSDMQRWQKIVKEAGIKVQ